MSSFKEFMTKPRVPRQYGSFPLIINMRTSRYWRPWVVQAVTHALSAFVVAMSVLRIYAHESLLWPWLSVIVIAALAVVAQFIYYTTKGQNTFQLYRSQYGEEKKQIAYLKEHHLG